MRLAVSLAAVLAAISLAQSVNAGVIRDDVPDLSYTTLAADSRYQSVGQFTWSDTQYNYYASGVLIQSPGNIWVLTAGHVLDTSASRTFTIAGTSYEVAQSVLYPKWTGNLNQGYDIALAKLSTAPTGITPAALYTGSSEVGQLATFVGYGMTGTGITGATTFDSVKRAGTNVIDVLYRSGGSARMFGVDFDNPSASSNVYGSASPTALEYLTSFGDSGGGAFIDVGGKTYLAGITSWGSDYNGNGLDDDYGDIAGYTRVSAFTSWIDSVVNGSGGGGGTGGHGKGGKDLAIAAAAPVPEPASLAVLSAGVLGLLTRRRRSR